MRLEAVWQDLRHAARGLRQRPGFTIAVALALGLGIGANAAMFGIVDRLLFRAPAFMRDPDRVHRVYLVRTFDGKENPGGYFQYTRFKDLERWSVSFDAAAAMSEPEVAVGVGDEARQMRINAVSAGYWSLFAMRPELGRFFAGAEDTTPSGARVTVLSYPFWQSRYGGRADALGRAIRIGNVDYVVIGVAPPGFTGAGDRPPVAWVPITAYAAAEFTWNPRDPHNWFQKYNISWLQMLARRKPGVGVPRATEDLTNAYRRSYAAQREMSPGTTLAEIARPRAMLASALAERGPQASAVSKVAGWVAGVAFIVLLIAAANVANLLLARALRRRREIAVRLALGVTRGRLLSQLLTESLLLAGLGGAVGLLLAQWGGAILRSQFLQGREGVSVIGDGRTLVFGGVAVILVGLLTGLAPALQAGRGDLTRALKAGAREGTYHRSRTRAALLLLQGALSVVLLVGAGLFVRSLANVRSLRMGYDIDRLVWVSVEERGEQLTQSEKTGLRTRLLERAQALPFVVSAARAVTVPYWMTWDEELFVSGLDSARIRRMGSFTIQAATPEYLRTVGTGLLRGRFLENSDTKESPPVIVVSEAMAAALWPGKDPIGQCVRVGADTVPCSAVVGVAENIRSSDFEDDKMLHYYRSISQTAETQGGLFVRVRGDPAREGEAIRRALQPLMPGAGYVTARPMAEIFEPNVRSWRLGATMFVAFGVLALVLAGIGLYSVIAYNVVQRTHEIGVRVAFGARMPDLIRLIMTDGLRLAVLGLAIGSGVALYAGRWVAPLLFRQKPADPVVFGGVIAMLLGAAVFACLIPALRAARVDPNVALRSE
ncbi:MAG TPA: ADOP family duplicated permease [Gemmatimonadales bacterium]|nr:ADOP family duplicated permease [Gemmatimonadales bacterium]